MSKDPAFLFYSQDFITGVTVLDFHDRGRYITLLALMHQQGRMSEDTVRFIVGDISQKLRSKFSVDEGGNWYNERLELEIEKRKKFISSRRENGSQGGRPKKPLAKPNGYAYAKPLAKPSENLPENVNSITVFNKNMVALENSVLQRARFTVKGALGFMPTDQALLDYFEAFKGNDEVYENEAAMIKHFIGWIKFQVFNRPDLPGTKMVY